MASHGHIDAAFPDCLRDLQIKRKLSGREMYVLAARCHQNKNLGRTLTAPVYREVPESPFMQKHEVIPQYMSGWGGD